MAGMALKKCVYVVATPGYQPEMCAITLPNLKQYADRLKADFRIITERKFPEWPVVCEKQQIHELGTDYDWNISIDADMLVHPAIDDFTEWHPPTHVGNWWYYDMRHYFDVEQHPYFARDGRFYGIVECLVASSKYTHQLWEPLSGHFDDYKSVFKDHNYWRMGEYCLSHNLAKYGLKISGMLRRGDNMFHINHTSGSVERPEVVARAKLKEWGA
jgi:hypothetical protein